MAEGGVTENMKEHCAICKKSEESDKPGDAWVMCTACEQWLHVICAATQVPDEDEPWFCADCDADSEKTVTSNVSVVSHKLNVHKDLTDVAKNDDVDEEKELELVSSLIQEQEKLCVLKQRQLDIMERLSQKNTISKVNGWLKKTENANSNADKIVDEPAKPTVKCRKPSQFRARSVLSVRSGESGRSVKSVASSRSSQDERVLSLLESQMKLMSRQYLQELPEFSGEEGMWPIFYSQFVSTTEQAGFDDAYNLSRLRKSLKGEALKSVKGILALPNSLSDVLRLLKKRFGSYEVIVKGKLKKLEEQAAPNENKPATIIDFFEFLQDLNATLMNVGATNYLRSPQTLDAAVSKLPPGMSRSWIMRKRSLKSDVTLDHLINWLEPFYECAILSDRESSADKAKKLSGRVNIHKEPAAATATTLTKSASAVKSRDQCSFCRNNDHNLLKCAKFTNQSNHIRWNFVRKRGLCFVCLLGKHQFNNCDKKKLCGVDRCEEFHHPHLHRSSTKATVPNNSEVVSTQAMNGNKTHFRVLPVTVHNIENGRKITTWAFLDEGSSPTMLSESIATELGVSGEIEELCTSWTDSSVRKEPMSRRVTIEVSRCDDDKKFKLRNVRTVSQLNLPMPDMNITSLKSKYKHLADVNIPAVPASCPGLLIGLEHAKLGLMYAVREGKWNEPVASLTRLGWAIHGKEDAKGSTEYSCHVCDCQPDQELHEVVKEFFTTEAFGVHAIKKPLESKDDERARQILENTTRKFDTCYDTGLIWANDEVQLPDNRKLAMQRLLCFEQKLNRNETLKNAV